MTLKFFKILIFSFLFFSAPFILTTSSKPISTQNILIDQYDSLIIYWPQYKTIDLTCGIEAPYDEDVLYCCAGAFTAKCLDTFCHENVRCNHVCSGTFFNGSEEALCTGVFTFYNGQGHFGLANEEALHTAADNGGMGFEQVIIILNDSIIYKNPETKEFWMKQSYVFRALCEKDGKLCIIQSQEKIPYADFVRLLAECDVRNAIYLDMGGWGHAQYCDNTNTLVETTHVPTRFATNWLTFRK